MTGMNYDPNSTESRTSLLVSRLVRAIHPEGADADPLLLPANPNLIHPTDPGETGQRIQNQLSQLDHSHLHPLLAELEEEKDPEALISRLEYHLEILLNPIVRE